MSAWYDTNREQAQANARVYYSLHREESLAQKKIYRALHRDEINIRQRVYNLRNRNNRRILTYGLAPEEFQEMLAIQGGLCAICHDPMVRANEPQIDHDHETGRVRGLLCARCNLALGQ